MTTCVCGRPAVELVDGQPWCGHVDLPRPPRDLATIQNTGLLERLERLKAAS